MSKHARALRLALVLPVLLLAVGGRDAGAATPPPLRFSAEFPVSPLMEARVRFWIRVFTEVSQQEAVLHDRDDVRIVYDVVPYDSERSVDPVRASYARLLATMAVGELFPVALVAVVPQSPERQRIERLFTETTAAGPIAYARAIGNIRAQRGLKEIFADSLARSDLYLPAIRRIFADAGLPPELVYLPHV